MTEPRGRVSGRPGWRIVFAGTGGQGVITAARLLTEFFVDRGDQVVSGQLHGMAQRGGSVQASVMVNSGISPVIPQGAADCVVGFEPVETVRALPYMSARTTVLMNTVPVVPYVLSQQAVRGQGDGGYPSHGALQQHIRDVTTKLFAVDATDFARSAGLVRSLNVVMIGCLFGCGILPALPEEFIATVLKTTPTDLADANSRAFLLGVEHGRMMCMSEATT